MLQGSDDEKRAAGEVLTAVLEAARIVAVLLSPVTPALSARIHSQLGLEGAHLACPYSIICWGPLGASSQSTTLPACPE